MNFRSMRPSRATACTLLCAVAGALSAQPAPAQSMNAEGAGCQDAGSTVETVECFDLAYESADHQLQLLYARIHKVLGPAEALALAQAGRAWVQYRDATCSAERSLYGDGTGGHPTYLACLAAETRSRNASLLRSYGWRLEKFGGQSTHACGSKLGVSPPRTSTQSSGGMSGPVTIDEFFAGREESRRLYEAVARQVALIGKAKSESAKAKSPSSAGETLPLHGFRAST
jgi:uncharacterized protein YecT (DUF1311 family)